ncbi:MAG: 50S ribosomal protein L28 [bacterium]|nr:50S ribosomal protein L28 [bacterium]
MSRIDILTGKRANTANSRSHSKVATKRRQNVNLQTIRLEGVKIRVAARTLRTLKKLTKELTGELPTLRQKRAAKRVARENKAKA